jgi:alpha-methylacyl-CoA racemase
MPGPLQGIKIIELAGIGPAPFCGMMLADHGAQVIRVDRIGGALRPKDALSRSRVSITADLKTAEGAAVIRDLVKNADGLIEGFRPGVMERLGLGPEILLQDNPRLVYGRMTGWGQYGPYAQSAGHDINYIALSGALHTCGRAGQQPSPPVNYVGDFGGGGMMLAFGMVSALLAVRGGAPGQVIDCAMTDGAAALMGMTWALYAEGLWQDEPGVNTLDSGAPFYDTYETKDGKWISIGSIEPQFYRLLLEKTGLGADPEFARQNDPRAWPSLKEKLRARFLTRSRDEWCATMEMTDICFAPVLSLSEAPSHPHNEARKTFTTVAGAIQPAPAPRYSVTQTSEPRPAPLAGADTDAVLAGAGYAPDRIAELRQIGAIG